MYREWKKQNPGGKGFKFLDNLIEDWGIEWPLNKGDAYSRNIYEEMMLGLSFAQIKLEGECEEPIIRQSLEVVKSIRKRIEEKHRDWEHFEERLRTLDEIECKLSML